MPDFRVPRSSVANPDDADEVAWVVIERMYDELRTPYEPDPRLETCSLGQRALYALHWTRSEVVNGGFSQFFLNSTGSLWREAVDGARHVGADDYAAIIEGAGKAFPDGSPPGEVEERRALLGLESLLDDLSEEVFERFDPFDDAFYDLLDRKPLSDVLAAYVWSHPAEFFA